MTRLGEMASFDTVESEVKEVAGIRVRVATPMALYLLTPTAMTTTRRVQKFRSIDEMNAAQAVPSDAGDFDRFLRHCARYWALAPRAYPRGVFKFRSVEEAQRARERHGSSSTS